MYPVINRHKAHDVHNIKTEVNWTPQANSSLQDLAKSIHSLVTPFVTMQYLVYEIPVICNTAMLKTVLRELTKFKQCPKYFLLYKFLIRNIHISHIFSNGFADSKQ